MNKFSLLLLLLISARTSFASLRHDSALFSSSCFISREPKIRDTVRSTFLQQLNRRKHHPGSRSFRERATTSIKRSTIYQDSSLHSTIEIESDDIENELSLSSSSVASKDSSSNHHLVDGLLCREISMDVPVVGTVTILEATAEAQDNLVDMALELDTDEKNDDGSSDDGNKMKLSAGDPYGAVLWPAAWAVAKYLLTTTVPISEKKNQQEKQEKYPLEGHTVLELGTGTGLVSISAWLGGAKKVIATDYEPLALKLTTFAAQKFHSPIMPFPSTIETCLLDMCKYDDLLPITDDSNINTNIYYDNCIVVAADIMYEPKTGIAMAHRAVEALKKNCRVIVGDSPGRPGRGAFLKTLIELGISSENAIFTDTLGRTCSGPRHELICGKGSKSVSDTVRELPVAIMDLHPSMLRS